MTPTIHGRDDGIVVVADAQEGYVASAWDIRREGRSWTADEALGRFERTPEKIEMIDGKLFCEEEDRLVMLGLLLENVGADVAVRLGNPAIWRDAVAHLR